MAEPTRSQESPWALSDAQLAALATEFAAEAVHAVVLLGSYARGDADAFSDVDLKCFVHQRPKPRSWFGYRDGRFVTVFYGTVEERFAELGNPEAAIWAVPAFRTMRVLLDREGQAEALRQAALAFEWAPLQPLADEQAGDDLAYRAEYVHKLLGGLEARDASRVVGATWELVTGLTQAVATHRGVLVPSDRQFFRLVQEAVGRESGWSRQQRLAAGVAMGVEAPYIRPPWEMCGVAALRLYCETALLLRPILIPDRRDAVDGVVQRIAASGWAEAS